MQNKLTYNQIVDMFNASPDTKIPGYDVVCCGHKPGKGHKVIYDFEIKSDFNELYEHAFRIEYDKYYYVPYDLTLGSRQVEPGTTVNLHTVESIENFVISCDCEIKELKDVIERIIETGRGYITKGDDLGNIEITTDSSILTLLSTHLMRADFPTLSDSTKNDDNSYKYTITFDAFTIEYV